MGENPKLKLADPAPCGEPVAQPSGKSEYKSDRLGEQQQAQEEEPEEEIDWDELDWEEIEKGTYQNTQSCARRPGSASEKKQPSNGC